jgi:hypothetical protein
MLQHSVCFTSSMGTLSLGRMASCTACTYTSAGKHRLERGDAEVDEGSEKALPCGPLVLACERRAHLGKTTPPPGFCVTAGAPPPSAAS